MRERGRERSEVLFSSLFQSLEVVAALTLRKRQLSCTAQMYESSAPPSPSFLHPHPLSFFSLPVLSLCIHCIYFPSLARGDLDSIFRTFSPSLSGIDREREREREEEKEGERERILASSPCFSAPTCLPPLRFLTSAPFVLIQSFSSTLISLCLSLLRQTLIKHESLSLSPFLLSFYSHLIFWTTQKNKRRKHPIYI